jgi:hypothetical protein
MLLQLENTSRENINRLLDFAKDHNLKLELVDDANDNHYLPGESLSNEKLLALVEKSRNSGTVPMQEAHDILRKAFNAN